MRKWLMSIIWLISAAIGGYSIMTITNIWNERSNEWCTAARQTVVEESDLIATSGKFPGEQITDRWKKLLEGC